MLPFLLRRLLQALPTLFAVTVVVFLVLELTGDPVALMLGDDATDEAIARVRTELGLDDPIHVRYLRYLVGAVQGDFGHSPRFNMAVSQLFVERIPATLELAAAALVVSLVIGLVAGVFAAVHHGSAFDHVARFLALLGQAVPNFFLGIVAIIVFGAQLGWLPTGGRGTAAHLVLPALTLGTYYAALTMRFVRGAMLDVLNADYVRTARSKGLPPFTVVVKHAFRNAAIGVVTLIGLQMGSLLGGAVVTETVFSWPGVGRMAIQAIYARDFPLVQITILAMAATFVFVNVLADVVYSLVDPRIRLDGDRR